MGKNDKNGNGWSEYQKLVLSKLESHDVNISDILKQVQTTNEHLYSFKAEAIKAIDDHKTSCVIVEEFPKFSRDIEGIKASLNNIRKSEKEISENTKAVNDIKVDVAQLQVKSGLWGALGGIVAIAVVVVATLLKNDFSSAISSIFH